jgi:hypothetical protein
MTHDLSHENLDAYKLARSVARWVRATPFPRGDAALKDQAKRAADSVVLRARQEPKRRCRRQPEGPGPGRARQSGGGCLPGRQGPGAPLPDRDGQRGGSLRGA